jgi:threonine synthase
MGNIFEQGYIAEPHTAIAYQGLEKDRSSNDIGIFLSTAHCAKFSESVEQILQIELDMPTPLATALKKECLAIDIDNDYAILREVILNKLD